MSHDLHDPLHDLVADVPRHVVHDDLPARAWSIGRRRRIRRRAFGTGALVVLLGLLGVTISPALDLPHAAAPAGAEHGGVHGYPQRIDRPWLPRRLPDRPGPLAGAAQLVDDHGGHWWALGPDGATWQMPPMNTMDVYPTLSQDGTKLGYLGPGTSGGYVIHDLVTGAERRFPGVGSPLTTARTRFWAQDQSPAFWSPDGQHLVLSGARRRGPAFGGLLLGADGSVRLLQPTAAIHPAGWLDNSRLAWLDYALAAATHEATLVVTDLGGHTVRRTPLDLRGLPAMSLGQWSGDVSPDGRVVALLGDQSSDAAPLALFDTRTGRRIAAGVAPRSDEACPTSWQHHTLVGATLQDFDGVWVSAFEHLSRQGGRASGAARTITVTDPSARVYCAWFTADALAGTAHGWPLGLTDTWWAWHARTITLVLVGAVLAAVVLWLRRRRRPIL